MIDRIIRGGAGGLVATGAMTAVMFAGKRLGLMGSEPPKQITRKAAWKVGLRGPKSQRRAFNVGWLAAHVAYGAGAGSLYALLRPLLPGSQILSGLLYGVGLWAGSYFGLMPALGLYPPPQKESAGHVGVMATAHAVYGTVLAKVVGVMGVMGQS